LPSTKQTYSQNLASRVSIRSWLGRSTLARIDAESLLCYVLDKPRSFLFSHSDTILSDQQSQELALSNERRINGEPLPYITGVAEFWSMPLTVTHDVLIPRDDTGCLVEVALALWKSMEGDRGACADARGAVVDAGTGSGIVAVAFATETGVPVIATDFSAAALQVASGNGSRLAPGLIEFVQANWLNAISPSSVQLLLSNPPYIKANDPHLNALELQHEPQTALVAGKDGLYDLRCLAQAAPSVLVSGGAIALEHGYDQAKAVQTLLLDAGLVEVATVQDLSGNDRVTHAKAL